MPPSTPPPPRIPSPQLPIHTYHCLCSTLLLATPYTLSHLPVRAPPSKDDARILPLPPLLSPGGDASPTSSANTTTAADKATEKQQHHYPSLLLPALRPARKFVMVQREDGFERRRVWRCGRCGVVVGYEVEREQKGEAGRVVFLLEGGLVETGEMVGGGGEAG